MAEKKKKVAKKKKPVTKPKKGKVYGDPCFEIEA